MTGGSSWRAWSTPVRAPMGLIRLSWRLFREPGVPALIKSLPVIALLNLLSPLVIYRREALAAGRGVSAAPQSAVVIDAKFRREEPR